MKKLLTIALAALLMAACQPKNFREIYPEGNPVIQATMLTDSVLFGSDSVTFRVVVDEKETNSLFLLQLFRHIVFLKIGWIENFAS